MVRALNPFVIGRCAGEASVERPGRLSSAIRRAQLAQKRMQRCLLRRS